MTVSIIVHNINRAAALDRCLTSIAAQTYRPLEVVILDAGSTDESVTVIGKAITALTVTGIQVRSYQCPLMGVAASRNLGALKASGALLCFLDNDAAFVDPAGVARAAAAFLENQHLGVISFRIFNSDSSEPDVTAWVFRRPLKVWFSRPFDTFTFLGGGFCVRAQAFRAAGGFWDYLRYSREEEDLGLMLIHEGWRIAYSPDISLGHYSDARGRASLAQRRRLELHNGLLVLWRRLPVLIAVPMIVARVLSMTAKAILSDHRQVGSLLLAIPEAISAWRSHALQRQPISCRSFCKYLNLHRCRV